MTFGPGLDADPDFAALDAVEDVVALRVDGGGVRVKRLLVISRGREVVSKKASTSRRRRRGLRRCGRCPRCGPRRGR